MTRYEIWKNDRIARAPGPAGILPSRADGANIEFVDVQGLALPPGTRTTPDWLKQEKLCFVGCWDSLGWRRHSAISTTWDEANYAFEHSQDFLEDVKALGCNAVIIPFDFGCGGSVRQEEFARAKTFAALIHANGLRVGTYFRPDTVWAETLSPEEWDELGDGFQKDSNGRDIQILGSSSRNLCYHHPGPLRRLKRSIEWAIKEIETDILHLDGMVVGGDEGMRACRCAQCLKDYRAFLMERYGRDRGLAQARFGDPCLETKHPPQTNGTDKGFHPELEHLPCDHGARNPQWGEWIAFRCAWTTRILAEIAAWTRALNPQVMIEINNALPSVRENGAMLFGMDAINLGHYVDANWAEDGYGPRFHSNGMITNRVRQFKLCRAARGFALTYMSEANARELRQNLAHTAAFNEGNIGCIGFPPHLYPINRYDVHFEIKCGFMKWLNAHKDIFRDTRSDARIVVWRPRENLAISGRLAYAASMRIEQLLLETGRGFDFSFEESPGRLSAYDLIVLPNIECMRLAQIEECLAYVEKGGSLLIGQSSAAHDMWHRRRTENVWAALFGDRSAIGADVKTAANPAAVGMMALAGAPLGDRALVRAERGKGKAVYVPLVVDPATQPSVLLPDGTMNYGFDYTNWIVPEDAQQISGAIDWLLGERPKYIVKGERGLLAEFMVQDKLRRRLVHLVNLKPEPQRACEVVVRGPDGLQAVDVLFPPTDQPPEWTVINDQAAWRIVFKRLDTYAIIVLTDFSIRPACGALIQAGQSVRPASRQ